MEAGKAFLRTTNEDGVSVYSHLTSVLATLLEAPAANALDAFEGVSLGVKAKHYKKDKIAVGPAPPELPDPNAPVPAAEPFNVATAALVKATKPAAEPEEPTGEVANVMYERTLFECAGVGVSSAEAYRVYLGLIALQKSKDLASVSFFGKLLGAPGDYYIAQAKYNTPPEPPEDAPPPPPGMEEAGTGCNAYVYFAASDPSGEWTVLPDVTPQQIVMSKKIRKYLTGDLGADVRAYPPFPGKEAEYLRALIARITAATTLCPVGKFALTEEGEVEPTPEGDDGPVPPAATSALGELGGWCTRFMGILDIGRCTNIVEEEGEDEEKPKGPAPQPHIPYLSPLSGAEWAATTYTHGAPTVAVAKSLLWPGAYNAYQLAKGIPVISTLYIGYGQPMLSAPFVMEAPPAFEAEPEEVHEQADMPLAEENAIFLEKEKARIAEEAAALPDPEE